MPTIKLAKSLIEIMLKLWISLGKNDIFTVFALHISRDTTFLPLIVLIFQNVVIFLCIDLYTFY